MISEKEAFAILFLVAIAVIVAIYLAYEYTFNPPIVKNNTTVLKHNTPIKTLIYLPKEAMKVVNR